MFQPGLQPPVDPAAFMIVGYSLLMLPVITVQTVILPTTVDVLRHANVVSNTTTRGLYSNVLIVIIYLAY